MDFLSRSGEFQMGDVRRELDVRIGVLEGKGRGNW
jgi:hypothetical protein